MPFKDGSGARQAMGAGVDGRALGCIPIAHIKFLPNQYQSFPLTLILALTERGHCSLVLNLFLLELVKHLITRHILTAACDLITRCKIESTKASRHLKHKSLVFGAFR